MADLSIGTTIAGYRIEAMLGHGSMGTVYSALDSSLDRRVALKMLTPELARDDRFRERFLRESKLAASLEHPHIVPIYAAGDADGQLFLAMRYIEGRDLAALRHSLGRLDPDRAVAILAQIAAALDAAHARGLVHRDVKPANIMLTQHGGADYAYLCDFGLAKHASTVSSLTGSRAIVGTVDYLAPEQIEGKPLDGRADVYALGCVLFECLTGRPPYERGNELAALLAHVNDPPPPISQQRAELPEALDQVVATALAKDRNLRYGTCADLVQAARAAVRGDVPVRPQQTRTTSEAVRTFLFADVRGYTSYTREHGDEAAARLAGRFAELVEELAPKHAGGLQELRGDEALVVFDSARQALRFALALQATVVKEELARPVGIGLDAGEAVPVDDGFRGTALNRAARLCAIARPGEVLASDAVRELAGQTDGVAYGFRRVERLKGFEKPVGVVEIHAPESAPRRQLKRQTKRALLGTRPRRRIVGAVVLLAAVAVAVPLVALRGGDRGAHGFSVGSIALLDAASLKPVGSFADLGAPGTLISDSNRRLWAVDFTTGSVAALDPSSRKVTARFPLNVSPNGFAAAFDSLWVADGDHPALLRYDPVYGTVAARIALPAAGLDFPDFTNWVVDGAGSIWVSYGKWPFRIARIDPATNRVVKTIDLPRANGQAALAFGGGSLWVVSQDTGRLWRIDPTTNAVVARAKLHDGWVEDIRVVNGNAWLPIENDRAVWKVDAGGNILKSIPTGDLPVALAVDGDHLFVANQKSSTLSRIDTRTDAVTTVDLGHRPETPAVAAGLVWVPLSASAEDATAGLEGKKVAKIVTDGDPLYNIDPAVMEAGGPQNMLQGAIGARLLRFPDVAQRGGATLEPEIADLPVVSDGGRTYTFRIRPGYRFSPPSKAFVTAESMRYTIERVLSPKITDPLSQAHNIVGDIAGLKAFREKKAAHISGIRVLGNRLSITLLRPAPDFPVRISLNWFSAIPLGTPILPHGVGQPIPSAGPYYLSAHVDNLTEVVRRNPNYSGPRPHAIDAFVFENAVGTQALPDRVSAGSADYVWGEGGEFAPGGPLDRRYGDSGTATDAQYFAPGTIAIRYLDFNTTSGVFRDPKLRQAVSYALDRRTLATIFDGAPAADPLPPGLPGAGANIPYPLDKPDLARARELAGPARRTVTLYSRSNGPNDAQVEQALAVITRDLGRIGITVRVRRFDDPWSAAARKGAPVDLLLNAWYGDYADPSTFLNVLFDPLPLGYGYQAPYHLYGDRRFLSGMRRAYSTKGARRATAYRRLVGAMMRMSPPTAVFAVPRTPGQVFSARIGCQVFRPQDSGYVDLAALCLP